MIAVMDTELNGLFDATKIHCLCYYDLDTKESKSFTNLLDIRNFLSQPNLTLIGHNLILFDIRILEKLLKIKIKARLIDTLALSWYLEPNRNKHGLGEYGEDFGVPKPPIVDWDGLETSIYVHRCEEDVKINTILWRKQWNHLMRIYEDRVEIHKFIDYISFKMDCVREQEETGIRLDVKGTISNLERLEKIKSQKVLDLEAVMPKVPIFVTKSYPKNFYKKDGSLSKDAEKWLELVKDIGLPPVDFKEDIRYIKGYKEPNCNSHDQIKDWLYSLGWVPEHIKHVRNKDTGEVKKIPQIGSKAAALEGTGEICDSIKILFEKEPALEILEGLFVTSHRISLLKGFLKNQKNGMLYPTTSGLTNTLRLQHSIIVNLPSVDKLYGKECRGALIANEGSVLCGSDLSGVEDNTKRHYIYFYDPKYVEDMKVPGYDPHLELGVMAGMITQEEMEFYKNYEKKKKEDIHFIPTKEDKERFGKIKVKRFQAKTTNFSATYKVGAATLSRNLNLPLSQSKMIIDTYWIRNKAILDVEKSLTVKRLGGQMWQQNPVNKFWYSLRAMKDQFSTLNQGTAVYVFDRWIYYIRKQGVKISYQCHDEFLTNIKKGREEYMKKVINKAIDKTNEELKLNVTIGCSMDLGNTYAETH